MSKPIWDLEPDAIENELVRATQRKASPTEAARINRMLTDMLEAGSLAGDTKINEFEESQATVFEGGALGTEVAYSVVDDEVTRPAYVVFAPNKEPIVTKDAKFATPTTKLSSNEIAQLRQKVSSPVKK